MKINLHLREIFDALKEILKKAADDAEDALSHAQERLDGARSSLSHANDKMSGWQSDMSAFQSRLKARSAEIERMKQQFVASCKSRCGTGMLDFNCKIFSKHLFVCMGLCIICTLL